MITKHFTTIVESRKGVKSAAPTFEYYWQKVSCMCAVKVGGNG